MKKDWLKKISKILVAVLVLGMFISGTPSVKAEDDEPKDIAVGTTYYIGDIINFGSVSYFSNGKGNAVRVDGNLEVTLGSFTAGEPAEWIVNLKKQSGPLSLWFYDNDFTGNEIVRGVKCISGEGTQQRPYTFELIYEDPLVGTIKVINGTRSSDEGTSDDHTVTDPEATVYFGSGDYVTLGFMQPSDGYTKTPIVKRDGQAITLVKNYDTDAGDNWSVSYYEAGQFPNTYPNGYIRISGNPTASADFVVEYQPIDYTIIFDPNGGSGYMDPIDAKYDVEAALPKSTMTHATKIFDGWNTKNDGTGDSYDDEAKNVKNLTKTDGAEVTLYAKWRDPVVQEVEITDVSFTIVPPNCGDKIAVVRNDDNTKQTPTPVIKSPSGREVCFSRI